MSNTFREPLWDDGLAEVSLYDATRDQYGISREFVLTMITVKESFDRVHMVKSDSPQRDQTLSVIKNHLTFTMPTENYPYQLASSSFISRQAPLHLWKMSGTSSEWCGITTRTLRGWQAPPQLEYRSYFGSERDNVQSLDWPSDGVTEEQLLVSLRAISFTEGLRRPIQVLERQLDSHAGPATWRPGEIEVKGIETVSLADGSNPSAWRVDITLQGGDRLTYAFGVEAPHLLLEHEAPGGVSLRLRDSRRWAYWAR